MNSTPLVSVCVPCYNVAPYIGRLLTSLIEQTYKHLEIILVDDGSTDETHEIITAYIPQLKQEGYNVIYVRQENGGQSAAINTGLKYVTGEFFTWPDADDWMTPNAIEKLIQFLLTHPNVHMVRGNVQVCNETPYSLHECIISKELQPYHIINFYEKLLVSNAWFAPIATMIRFSSFLEANGGRDIYVSKQAGQNWQLMLPIASQYECWQLPEVLGYYLIRENSHSRQANNFQKKYDYLVMCEDVLVNTIKKLSLRTLPRDIKLASLFFTRQRFFLALENSSFKMAVHEYKKLFTIVSIKEKLKKAYLLLLHLPLKKIKQKAKKVQRHIHEALESYYHIKGFLQRFYHWQPHILTETQSISKIISTKKSLTRFGDGEFGIIYNQGNGFQSANHQLSERLKEVLSNQLENLLIGLPNVFGKMEDMANKPAHYWYINLGKNRKRYLKLINKKQEYLDSNMSRFWTAYKDRKKAPKIVAEFKKLWEKRDIIFIEGEYSRLGVGNNLFNNAHSIHRILCPAENAWSKYDEILSAVTEISKDYPEALYILALGPTATVLAYDMCKMGLWAVDLGHIDIQYEYMLRNANEKITIPGKYVNENPNGKNVTDEILTKAYIQSILCIIK